MTTNKKKILVTESMSQQGRALLHARDDIELVEFPNMISAGDFEAVLKQQAPVHGVALGGTRFGEPELEASGDMKVVTRIGVGFDAVDVPALSRRKVPLMVAGTANSPSVAEQALFMMLTLAKRAVEMHSLVRDNKWAARLGMLPYDLFGKTVLIVGFGRIGTRTARRCLAMEMNVLIFDPFKSAADIKAAGCEPVSDLDAALPRADFVSIHCPKNAETVGMFNAARLKRMKPAAYLINTARGASSMNRRSTTRWCRASLRAPASTFSSRSRHPRPVAVGAAERHPGAARRRRHRGSRGPDERADRAQYPERARRRAAASERDQPGRTRLIHRD
jgi:D-3-phosphoglycerate dehydrogenase / 2-oxoglutarate reductase